MLVELFLIQLKNFYSNSCYNFLLIKNNNIFTRSETFVPQQTTGKLWNSSRVQHFSAFIITMIRGGVWMEAG